MFCAAETISRAAILSIFICSTRASVEGNRLSSRNFCKKETFKSKPYISSLKESIWVSMLTDYLLLTVGLMPMLHTPA